MDSKILTVSAVKGLIKGIVGVDGANIINALPVAKSKGIDVKESKTDKAASYSNLMEVKIMSAGKASCIRGTVFGEEPRLVNYNGYAFNVPLAGDMLFVTYKDTTGIVGKVGSVLGAAGVDIQQMAVSTKKGSDKAMMVLLVGKTVDQKIVDEIAKAVNGEAKFVELADN